MLNVVLGMVCLFSSGQIKPRHNMDEKIFKEIILFAFVCKNGIFRNTTNLSTYLILIKIVSIKSKCSLNLIQPGKFILIITDPCSSSENYSSFRKFRILYCCTDNM